LHLFYQLDTFIQPLFTPFSHFSSIMLAVNLLTALAALMPLAAAGDVVVHYMV
jgi:hypothetical protein